MFSKLAKLRSRSSSSGASKGPRKSGKLEPPVLRVSPSFNVKGTRANMLSGRGSRSLSSRSGNSRPETDADALAAEAETHFGHTVDISQRAAATCFQENVSDRVSTRMEVLRRDPESKQSSRSLTSLLPAHFETHEISLSSLAQQTCTTSSVPESSRDAGPDVLPKFEDAEEAFLEEFEDYFVNVSVDNVRKEQYPKLDSQSIVYLDYASFALFSCFQVEEHAKAVQQEAPSFRAASLGHLSSSHLGIHVTETHRRLLQLLNTTPDEYSVVFTTGYTAAFWVFAEAYSFQKGNAFLVCQDNHEAVKIIATAGRQQGVKQMVCAVGEVNLAIQGVVLRKTLRSHGERGGLFVFPAQSCLSGVKHSLNWVVEAQQNGWHVLLDVSTFLPSGSLDLSVVRPEFVVGSFRHLLGYPSGMGFLLVKKSAFTIHSTAGVSGLRFVAANRVQERGKNYHIVSEDEVINLLSFAALNFGLQHLEAIGLQSVRKRVQCLEAWLVKVLKGLHHNDKSLVQLYGPRGLHERGSIVAFNLVDSTGTIIPSSLVQRLAQKENIVIGTGYFNNPGLAHALSKASDRAKDFSFYDKTPQFSSIRVSFGPMSTFSDVYRLVDFLLRFRDDEYIASEAMRFITETQQETGSPRASPSARASNP